MVITPEWLKRFRLALEESEEYDQRSLAKKLGCVESTISQLLGRTPPKTSRFAAQASELLSIAPPEYLDDLEEELFEDSRYLRENNPEAFQMVRRLAKKLRRQAEEQRRNVKTKAETQSSA